MTNLVQFPFDRVKRHSSDLPAGSAEILLFTGVRIERSEFAPLKTASKPKRGNRSRQQAVKYQDE